MGFRFRGWDLAFKAQRLVYHSTLGWRVIKKKNDNPPPRVAQYLCWFEAMRLQVAVVGVSPPTSRCRVATPPRKVEPSSPPPATQGPGVSLSGIFSCETCLWAPARDINLHRVTTRKPGSYPMNLPKLCFVLSNSRAWMEAFLRWGGPVFRHWPCPDTLQREEGTT